MLIYLSPLTYYIWAEFVLFFFLYIFYLYTVCFITLHYLVNYIIIRSNIFVLLSLM